MNSFKGCFGRWGIVGKFIHKTDRQTGGVTVGTAEQEYVLLYDHTI